MYSGQITPAHRCDVKNVDTYQGTCFCEKEDNRSKTLENKQYRTLERHLLFIITEDCTQMAQGNYRFLKGDKDMRKLNLVLVIVGILFITESAYGALPDYEIIDLGTFFPKDINDAGHIVGLSQTLHNTPRPLDKSGAILPVEETRVFCWDEVDGLMDITEWLGDSPDYYINSAIMINNNGQIIFRSYREYSGGPMNVAMMTYLLWDSETGFIELTEFNSPHPIMGDRVRAINDNMQIVGTVFGPKDTPGFPVISQDHHRWLQDETSSDNIPIVYKVIIPTLNYHALLWDETNGLTDLGSLGGENSSANDINESSIVVGATSTGILCENNSFEIHTFLWNTDNGMIDLGTLNGNDSGAWAVNNYNEVVGASTIRPTDEHGFEINHAFVWTDDSGMIDIHDSNHLNSVALGINDASQVVGVFPNDITRINYLTGDVFIPSSIRDLLRNARYDPVFYLNLRRHISAFYWDSRYGMVELDDLLGEDSGWDYLESAEDINNKGQIIGRGSIDGQRHGFLLNPVPPIAAEAVIAPRALNLSSNGKWVTCSLWMPEEYDVADVDTDSILLGEQIAPANILIDEKRQVVTLEFNRADVQEILEAGEVELTVSGELVDGTDFEGVDTIKVIDKGNRKN